MAIDLKSSKKTKAIQAPRIVLFGVPGIGKSTFAAKTPDPIYQPVEDVGPIESTFLPYGENSRASLTTWKRSPTRSMISRPMCWTA